ncbi:hypothetical protein GOODEAATRI_018357 [Goodea atripinnis]|uniref:Uncharacterized protein n=1 Tax=Goodea atripinnis TaxID=208336 RepID=A0ABV0NBL3_9TELE
MIYTTWTTIATFLNLTIVLKYEANMSSADSATLSYALLIVVLLAWFIVENFVLDKYLRYVFIPYVVVIWALTGNLDKNYDTSSPSRNGIFIAVLLAGSGVLLAIRIVLVVWRDVKQPLFEDAAPETMEVSDDCELECLLSSSQKPPVKAPPLLPPSSPEPEDDFLILEDDAPLQFSIPRKSALSKRHRLSKSSSSNKESSTDKETKDGPVEVPQKQKEVEMATSKLDGQAVHQKMTKKKDKEKNPEVVKSDNDKGDSPTHQDLPADETIVEPEEEPAQKTGTKKHKSTKRKNLKGEKDIAAKGGKNSLKEKRKQAKASKAVWETEHGDVFRQLIQEHNVQEAADTEDLSDFTGNNRKQTKRRNARDEKIKEIAEKIITAKAELEDQQIPDEDPDPESSPLVFSKRDHGISSGPASQLCQPKEQLGETEPTKRRSKPPGEWWVVSTDPNDLEIIASQPWQPPLKEPKHQKKREKLPKQKPSRLGAPKNGNVASKTPGGDPVTHVRPLSTPKTVKRCLETFKDMFTSVGETPTTATNRDARQCKRRNVTSQAVEESPDTGPATYSRPDVRSGADVDECSQPDLEILPERACQTEDT